MLSISPKYLAYCFLSSAVLLSASSHSTPMDDAQAALNRNERSTAEKIYLSEAKKENPRAYSMLGFLYLGSYGGETDQKKSQDYLKKAFSLYLKAAKNGDTTAQDELGSIYSDEFSSKQYGVEKSVETSNKWYSMSFATYKKRAEAGDPESIRMLARAYQYGRGTEGDANEAVRLYKIAISKGSNSAMHDLGTWLITYPKYRKAGLQMLEKLADQGDSDVRTLVSEQYRRIGDDYEKGDGVPKDPSLAFQNFMKAATYGSEYSMFKVGMAFYNGSGTDIDKSKAATWFQKAAMNGLAAAQYNFGHLLARGDGIAPDYPRAYKCLVLADKGGIQEAKSLMNEIEGRMTQSQLNNAQNSADRWKAGEEL